MQNLFKNFSIIFFRQIKNKSSPSSSFLTRRIIYCDLTTTNTNQLPRQQSIVTRTKALPSFDGNNLKISTIFRNAIIKDEVDIAWSLYTSSSKRRDNNNNNNGNLTYADYCDLAKLLKNNGLVVDQTKIDLRLQQMEKIKSDIINSRIIHDIEIYNLLLIAYSKTKRFEGAKRFKLDHQIYVSFIHVFGNLGEIKELEIVFKDYLKLNSLKLNSSVFDSIIAQYLENKLDIEKSIAIYKQMLNKSLKPPKQTFNKIINAYFKNNQFENAKNFFLEEMEKRWNISVDIVTINTMISGNFRAALYHSGLISGGGGNSGDANRSFVDLYVEDAIEWYLYIYKNNMNPTLVTFHILLQGFGDLKQFDQVQKCLKEMHDLKVKPDVTTFHALADIYGKNQDIKSLLTIWSDLINMKTKLNNQIITIDTWIVFIKSLIFCNEMNLALKFLNSGKEEFGSDKWNNNDILKKILANLKEPSSYLFLKNPNKIIAGFRNLIFLLISNFWRLQNLYMC
ncbi:21906_t:CDS:2 [Entrophospora sp. SA101]|nr:16470_t:CDS:2 [Entrophospora sp. SA101]CAJ0755392.1 21906_t:CDS:2 [Entrophospora sp. SA101]CAJ0836451.1 669_t:CDS:2 [Entrophospora sp. SA101]CAJ0923940.1 22092_t:CDS:2 [Entrophospora sp. SA101]